MNANEWYKGQKVVCVYYNEEVQYPAKMWLWSQPFAPVKCGVVIRSVGIKPYYLSGSSGQEYLLVSFAEYLRPKEIPISCIHDAKKYAEDLRKFIDRDIHRLGQKGYDVQSYNELNKLVDKANSFSL